MCVNDTKYAIEASINTVQFSTERISLQNCNKKKMNESLYMIVVSVYGSFMNVCVFMSVCELILIQQCLIPCIPVLDLGGVLRSHLCPPLITRAGFLFVCLPHTAHVCLDTQPLCTTLTFSQRNWRWRGGSRGYKGGGQRWQEERGVEFESRVNEWHWEPGILYKAKMLTLIK